MKKSMLIDTSKCMGCRGCQVACKQWNQLPAEKTQFTGTYENPPRFSGRTWTKIVFKEYEEEGKVKWLFTKSGCMHCAEAACVKVCPAGAISHSEYGAVVIDEKKCIGCNYCVANCTFNVIGFDQAANVARKCTFCSDRVGGGAVPACASTCPTGAITYGDRSDMIALARSRTGFLRRNGFPNAEVYGLEELDGLGMMYILKEGKENMSDKYGLPADPRVPFTAYLWNYIFKPVRVIVVLGLAFALWMGKSESKKQKDA